LTESEDLMNAYQYQIQSSINEEDWWDSLRKRAMTYEIYYRVYVRKPVLITSSGNAYVYDENNPVHVAAVNSGKVRVENSMFSKMRLAFFIGPHRIADMDSPHP